MSLPKTQDPTIKKKKNYFWYLKKPTRLSVGFAGMVAVISPIIPRK